jgi:hypothetical protein
MTGVCWFFGRALGRVLIASTKHFDFYLGDGAQDLDAKDLIGISSVLVTAYLVYHFALSGGRIMTTEAAQVEAGMNRTPSSTYRLTFCRCEGRSFRLSNCKLHSNLQSCSWRPQAPEHSSGAVPCFSGYCQPRAPALPPASHQATSVLVLLPGAFDTDDWAGFPYSDQ